MKTQQSPGKKLGKGNHMIIVPSTFSKISVFIKMFSVDTKTQCVSISLNSCDLKSVFVKLRFRDGLVWKAGLTRVKLKVRFQIFAAQYGQGLSFEFAEESYWFNKGLETSLNL